MCGRDLAVCNTSKCEGNKLKMGMLFNYRPSLNKNSKSRNSLNFQKVSFATVLKLPFQTIGPTSDRVCVPPQVSPSLNLIELVHDLTQGDDSLLQVDDSLSHGGDSLLEILQSFGESNDKVLEKSKEDCIKNSFSAS